MRCILILLVQTAAMREKLALCDEFPYRRGVVRFGPFMSDIGKPVRETERPAPVRVPVPDPEPDREPEPPPPQREPEPVKARRA